MNLATCALARSLKLRGKNFAVRLTKVAAAASCLVLRGIKFYWTAFLSALPLVKRVSPSF